MDRDMSFDRIVGNFLNGEVVAPKHKKSFTNFEPSTGNKLSEVVLSDEVDVDEAVSVAEKAFLSWSETSPVARGDVLFRWVETLKNNREALANVVAKETGKSFRDANGEMGAAIAQGEFFAGEGRRLYAKSLTSVNPWKYAHSIRQALGVVGLIVPANTPIANIAWKVFPALICGNTVVLKASDYAPETALLFAELSTQCELPDGVFNVIQGDANTGKSLVQHPNVKLISFTGSTVAGKWIAEACGKRMARVSLELGGKNPFIVCDDADLENAVSWACLSAFSNAGQRCASGSRIVVFDSIYEQFIEKLRAKSLSLRLGVNDEADLGPVISETQLTLVLSKVEQALRGGAELLCGGVKAVVEEAPGGYYLEPTLITGLREDAELANEEAFGPVATLHKVADAHEALALANRSVYGLTAAVHTRSVDRSMWFAQRIRAGTVNVNGGTYGSEPHMPFGGFGASGNGTREPGTEALDVYSELKNISFLVRGELI